MIPDYIREELGEYEDNIKQYRAGELGEVKMQKLRLHYGTYAQRQEGVQMQRIKIPGGHLTADQLVRLADAADRFGSGFFHLTTREDAQLYYVQLDQTPDLLRSLADAGITTREACGNTVRNITACYRAGTSSTEVFDVSPYAEGIFRFLVRNRYNQNLGRKFKITFEGCTEDHSALRIHDIGFQAQVRKIKGKERRGFRVHLGGGLGGAPYLGHLYTDFLPEEEMLNLIVSVLRLFDRYGERKARMKARMKFLVQTMGWNAFYRALQEERQLVGPIDGLQDYLNEARTPDPEIEFSGSALNVLDPRAESPGFQEWVRDSVIPHKNPRLRGVHVRMKLGDVLSSQARSLAEVVRRFSAGRLRISVEQNLYLPWVREQDLPDLHHALAELGLAETGAETIADVTTCPGSDTCRLGIASAKGLGSRISEALDGSLAPYRELARSLKVKISGCPNGCAQHTIADIGFHAAALSHEGRTVPAYLLFLGGKVNLDEAEIGRVIGRFPSKNGIAVMELLLDLFQKERQDGEDFSACMNRIGDERLKELLEPLKKVAPFEEDPSFYQDWGHENERFAIRQGIKGECAGSTVAEKIPAMDSALESLAQAEAYFYHHEHEHAAIAAYEAAAAAARVPLYGRLVDPFTSDQALWEFENIFVLAGQTAGEWSNLWSEFEALKRRGGDEQGARVILDRARVFVEYCAGFSGEPEVPLAAAAGGHRA